MTENLPFFVEIIAIAVVVQTLLLLGVGFAVLMALLKVNRLVKTTTSEVQARVLPMLDTSKVMLANAKDTFETARPKIQTVIDDVVHISSVARKDAERVNASVNDVLDRARLQVIRADEMVTRTMDRVEDATEKVQHSVMSPVRHVSGFVQAVTTGVGTFFGRQRRHNGGPSDEMFI